MRGSAPKAQAREWAVVPARGEAAGGRCSRRRRSGGDAVEARGTDDRGRSVAREEEEDEETEEENATAGAVAVRR